MPLHFETQAERAALTEAWQDRATVGAATVAGQFNEPQAEDLLTEGTAPEFISSLEAFTAAGVTRGSTIDSVTTFDGRTRGPFRVVRWASSEDGAFITVGLQQL